MLYLNPIEQIWDHFNQNIYALDTPPRDFRKMRVVVFEECIAELQNISIMRLKRSMKLDRCQWRNFLMLSCFNFFLRLSLKYVAQSSAVDTHVASEVEGECEDTVVGGARKTDC